MWDVATGTKLREVGGSEEFLTCLAVSPDGKTVATGGVDRAIRLWDVATGKKLRGGEGHLGGVGAVAFSPDGTALATASGAGLGGEHPVLLWEAATGKEEGRVLPPAGRQPSALAFSPDGRTLAVLTNSGALDLWDVANRKLLDNRITDIPAVRGFAYCAGGKAVATVAGVVDARDRLGNLISGTVDARWWDVATRKELHHLGGKDFTGVRSFALSADGQTLVVLSSQDNRFHLWDIPTGKERVAFAPPRGALDQVFSPDARTVAWRGGADATIHLLETATGKEELARLKTGEQGPASPEGVEKMRMLFAPDGKALAETLGQTVYLWDVTTGQELMRWRADQGAFESLAFSADGKLLASGGSDSTALVWRVRQGAK
jgi:WD40 repeat protein